MLKTFSEDEGLQFVKTGVTDLVGLELSVCTCMFGCVTSRRVVGGGGERSLQCPLFKLLYLPTPPPPPRARAPVAPVDLGAYDAHAGFERRCFCNRASSGKAWRHRIERHNDGVGGKLRQRI